MDQAQQPCQSYVCVYVCVDVKQYQNLREKLGPIRDFLAPTEGGDRAREHKPRPAPELTARVQQRPGAFINPFIDSSVH